MNNLINLFNLLNINPAYDKLPAVQITEITPEMLTAIKNNQTAMLEVLFNADSTPKYNLKIPICQTNLFAVIGVSGNDGLDAINLFGKHGSHKHVGQSKLAERKDKVCFVAG